LLLGAAHGGLHFLADEALAVGAELAQVAQGLAGRGVDAALVVVAHGVLRYHPGVGGVALEPLQRVAALDFQRVGQPQVKSFAVDIIGCQAAVAACVLAAEEQLVGMPFPAQGASPGEQGAQALFGVGERGTALFTGDAHSRGANCAHVEFFFGEIDADQDFFHTFVA